jgi:hypothetical protein
MKATRVTWTPGPEAVERVYADVFRIEISGYDIRVIIGHVDTVDNEGTVHAVAGQKIILPTPIAAALAASLLEALEVDMEVEVTEAEPMEGGFYMVTEGDDVQH